MLKATSAYGRTDPNGYLSREFGHVLRHLRTNRLIELHEGGGRRVISLGELLEGRAAPAA